MTETATPAASETEWKGPWTVTVVLYVDEGGTVTGKGIATVEHAELEAAVADAKRMLDEYKGRIDGRSCLSVEISPTGRVLEAEDPPPHDMPDLTPTKPDPKAGRAAPALADFPRRDHGPADPLRLASRLHQARFGSAPDGGAPMCYELELRDGELVGYRKNRAE